ncbi:MAG: 3-oxoacyl-[acyl-carrier-protein] synthase III C-terminal domain-containing protein [Pirellula sp.]
MSCFITRTGAYLPGAAVENEQIERFLGRLEGEAAIKDQILEANGIRLRHYAQDQFQQPTEDVYQLAARAVADCLGHENDHMPVTFLSAGSTYAPLSGPGFGSILHSRTAHLPQLNHPVEISSHGGICTSSAAAIVAAVRAIECGSHATALCVGAEHSSEVLKSNTMQPADDRGLHSDVRHSQWFMSVFLRFMLSDGAGAFLLQQQPSPKGLSLAVDWTHSQSMANETPLCMKLENSSRLLSQDVRILNRHLFPAAEKFVRSAFETHCERLSSYHVVLPHLSSFFFRRKMERMLDKLSSNGAPTVPYWTNLATVGNTGSASIYIMLNRYLQENSLRHGDRILLFIPESGQFNFVLISLTATVAE